MFGWVATASTHVLLLCLSVAWAEQPDTNTTVPDAATLEASGVQIREIILDKRNVFDLSDPAEDKWLYRWANRLHWMTRDSVINTQLLFRPGDPFQQRLLEESERILRANRFLLDASIEPIRYADGSVDIRVTTQDVWSLMPEFSFSRSGGENRIDLGLEETNLLGRGQLLRLKWIDNVDRTSTRLDFQDRNLGNSWVGVFLRLADNSDGHTRFLSVDRPFHSLDARWTAGGQVLGNDQRTAFYSLGDEAAEYRHEREYLSAYGGWSTGLTHGWVRRWSAGIVYDDNLFSQVTNGTLPALVPDDRELVYPFLRFEILEDEFRTSSNTNQIGRTEDFYVGARFTASLGWADESFGADRDALVFSAAGNIGFGSLSKTALLMNLRSQGRHEDGDTANGATTLVTRFYHRQSDKRLFFMTLEGTAGHNLDLDNLVELGGDSGLRGYPLRYQTGDSRLLYTIEQRYFTDWYPWRLFRVGGAIFFDVGRTWGDNPVGEEHQGWLKDVGFGFRFAPTRFSTKKVAHLDFAFPLDGDPSIDSVQILLEAKRSF
jgi:outer membrane protein assembly factor BamA